MRILTTALLLSTCIAFPCFAGLFSQECPNCRCQQLQKVCRVVPDVKKVTEIKYVVECEEICILGKSRCEERVVSDCDGTGGQRCETVWTPTCDRTVTKKKLKKVTTTIEKPTWKCVAETVCSQCGCQCGTANCAK